MNFLKLAEERYTTKKYDSSKKVGEDQVKELQEILRLSPSSINSQPWKFVFVEDEETKSKLAEASYFNEQKIKDASHVIAFSAIDDIAMFEAQIKATLPDGAIGYFNDVLKPLPDEQIKGWFKEQVYLSLGFFLSACVSMGIDSTPMEGIEHEKYDALVGTKGYKTLFAVAIGYRNTEDANQPSVKPKSRLALADVVKNV